MEEEPLFESVTDKSGKLRAEAEALIKHHLGDGFPMMAVNEGSGKLLAAIVFFNRFQQGRAILDRHGLEKTERLLKNCIKSKKVDMPMHMTLDVVLVSVMYNARQ